MKWEKKSDINIRNPGIFTLSFHYLGEKHPENHLDLFLDIDGRSDLVHYKCATQSRKIDQKMIMKIGKFHRRMYLHYDGEIKNNRGRLYLLLHGKFEMPEWLYRWRLKNNILLCLKPGEYDILKDIG